VRGGKISFTPALWRDDRINRHPIQYVEYPGKTSLGTGFPLVGLPDAEMIDNLLFIRKRGRRSIDGKQVEVVLCFNR